MKKLNRNESGFTIIEVVLVLAIAGLIFLVVFLALPQLQRSQRDSQRRSDVGRIVAGIQSWSTNNNGSTPADGSDVQTDVVGDYVDQASLSPYGPTGDGSDAVINGVYATNFDTADVDQIYYQRAIDCSGAATTNRTYAVWVGQEAGATYCVEG